MKIDEIVEVTGKTREEIVNLLLKEDFIELDLNEF